jgi:hypothetical protein
MFKKSFKTCAKQSMKTMKSVFSMPPHTVCDEAIPIAIPIATPVINSLPSPAPPSKAPTSPAPPSKAPPSKAPTSTATNPKYGYYNQQLVEIDKIRDDHAKVIRTFLLSIVVLWVIIVELNILIYLTTTALYGVMFVGILSYLYKLGILSDLYKCISDCPCVFPTGSYPIKVESIVKEFTASAIQSDVSIVKEVNIKFSIF